MIAFGELHSQFRSIEREIRDALDDVLATGRFIFGKHCAAFEEEFAAYVGVRYAVGVGSGTEAIHLALRALGVGAGDEVITAANTCVPTLAGISASGAAPVLVDVDPVTLTMDPGALERAMSPAARAIVPVHLYGHPCNMEPILRIADDAGVAVVEDCAQAHGAEYGTGEGRPWRRCGAFGAAGAFSFYPSKNLGAYGDAGAVTTNDPDVFERLRMLRNYGERERYHHDTKGYNSRLDEIQAAILRVKLRHLDDWNEARRLRAREYARLLEAVPIVLPTEAPWARSVYHLYVIRSAQRDDLRRYLDTQAIGTLLHYPIPIHRQKAYADLGLPTGSFPRSEEACRTVLSLPMYAELPFESIGQVAAAVRAFHRISSPQGDVQP